MLHRDYFMRMTEMLVKALTKIMKLKEDKKFEEAQKEIESEAKTIVGIDMKMIDMLNMPDVMMLMQATDNSSGRLIITAELLNQYGEVYEAQEKSDKAAECYDKSLRLFAEGVLSKQLPEPEAYVPRAEEMIEKLQKFDLNPRYETRERLISFYELTGKFSKGEDIIFELKDEGYDINEAAQSFYRKLLLKPDEELIAGNLSKEEVLESLEELKKNS